VKYLPGLTMNSDLPCLSLPSSKGYRCKSLAPNYHCVLSKLTYHCDETMLRVFFFSKMGIIALLRLVLEQNYLLPRNLV
jgi:hypothetical protein